MQLKGIQQMKKPKIKNKKQSTPKTPDQPNTPETPKTYKEYLEMPVNVQIETLQKAHIFFGIPCYGGMMGTSCFRSFVQMTNQLHKYGVNYTLSTIENESLVTRARNTIVAHFLASPNATHLMFIDADIEFRGDDVLRMIHYDKDIITGAYPKKGLKWEGIAQAAKEGTPPSELEWSSPNYVVNVIQEQYEKDGKPAQRVMLDDFGNIKLLDAGTGFMLIKRDVIVRMTEKFKDLKYNNDMPLPPEVAKHSYSLFDTMHDPVTNRYLSEDYTFCRRYQQMGGDIWLDPRTQLNHWGSFMFRGNVQKIFTQG